MARPTQLSTDRFALKLGLFYAAYFLYGGIQLPFFPLWLEARGFDPGTIGFVIAAPMIVRVFAVPVVTRAADRYRAVRAALILCSSAGALAMTAVGLIDSAVAVVVVFMLAAMAVAPMLPLSDAYALSGLGARGRAYGPVRLWGSVAFIAANVGAGYLLGLIAPIHLIWLIVAALCIAVTMAVALDPLEAPASVAGETRASPLQLWRNPAFLAVVCAAGLTQGSHALYYGFSTLDWRAAGFGGTTIGVLWALGVLAEIVLFAVATRLPFGPTAMLAIGAAGAIVRWSATAFEPGFVPLAALQLLHAASFGATHLGAIAFVARSVPKDLIATAQGIVATASAIMMAVATGLSGLVYAQAGSLAYLMMAAMALAGLMGALVAHRLARAPG